MKVNVLTLRNKILQQGSLLLSSIMVWLLLGACASKDARNNGDLVTRVPTTTAVPTQATAPATSTNAPFPASTPITPTPSLSASSITEDFFFGSSSYPSCQLPCWQGLIVGESGSEDIQAMFDTIFAFNRTRDFFPPEAQGSQDVPGLYTTGNNWILNEDPLEHFGVSTWVDRDSYTLRGLHFYWSSNSIDTHMTPKRIISYLGQPSHMLLSIERLGTYANLGLLLTYDEGMAFYLTVGAPITIMTTDNGKDTAILELCLGGTRWSSKEYDQGLSNDAYITGPLTNELNDLPPLEDYFIGRRIRNGGLRPLQTTFDTSLDEVTTLALQSEDACLHANLP